MRKMPKDLKKKMAEYKARGWAEKPTQNGHTMYYAPDGKQIVTVSGTPSDSNAINKIVADFKRVERAMAAAEAESNLSPVASNDDGLAIPAFLKREIA